MISLVIFGSRTAFPTFDIIEGEVGRLSHCSGWDGVVVEASPTFEIISGCAPGADACGIAWATRFGFRLHRMPADWNTHGKRAGFIRNRAMAERATHGLGFWHRESNGTANMCAHLVALNKPVRIVEVH